MYQFKAKDSEIKSNMLGLQNISKDFTANNIKKVWIVPCTIFLLIIILLILMILSIFINIE